MDNTYQIRRLRQDEIQAALDLTWEVFLEYEAPEYPPEGAETFRALLDDKEKTSQMKYWGAFAGDELIGTICVRAPQHIGGFFVRGEHHRKGVGRALFDAMRAEYETQVFTVNSSPYAVEVYRHLGFTAASAEQLADGSRFTPMTYGKQEAQ